MHSATKEQRGSLCKQVHGQILPQLNQNLVSFWMFMFLIPPQFLLISWFSLGPKIKIPKPSRKWKSGHFCFNPGKTSLKVPEHCQVTALNKSLDSDVYPNSIMSLLGQLDSKPISSFCSQLNRCESGETAARGVEWPSPCCHQGQSGLPHVSQLSSHSQSLVKVPQTGKYKNMTTSDKPHDLSQMHFQEECCRCSSEKKK